MRRRIAVGSVGLLLVSWNLVAVLGTDGGATALSSPSVGNGTGASIDGIAPVTSQQS